MHQSMVALTGIAVLLSAALWLSLHVAATAELAVLPAYCRRRLTWWRLNARGVYLGCAALALVAVAVELAALVNG